MAPERTGSFAIRSAAAFALAVIVVGTVATIIARDPETPADGARVELDGTASVIYDGGETSAPLVDGDVVRAGDEVVVESGTLRLRLANGGTMEGRGADESVVATRLEVGAVPQLLAGDVLLIGGAGTAVDAAGSVVAVASDEGVVRVRRGLSVLAGVYTGAAEVESAAHRRSVPALRQLGIGSLGRPAARPSPYVYDPADLWDLRYLGAAMDLSDRLDGFSRSYTANTTSPEDGSLLTLQRLLPSLAAVSGGGGVEVEAARLPGESLIGAAIVALGREAPFAERWAQVFSFRDEGADWGLVALDQRVDGDALLDDVGAALSRSARGGDAGQAAGPPPTEVPVVDAGPPATSPPPTPTTVAGSGADAPETTVATPPSTTQPPPSTPRTPLLPPQINTPTVPEGGLLPDTGVPLLDRVVDPVEEILGGLLGS